MSMKKQQPKTETVTTKVTKDTKLRLKAEAKRRRPKVTVSYIVNERLEKK